MACFSSHELIWNKWEYSGYNESYNVIFCSKAEWVQNLSPLVIQSWLVSLRQVLRYIQHGSPSSYSLTVTVGTKLRLAFAEALLLLKPLPKPAGISKLIRYSSYLPLYFWGKMSINTLVLKDGNLHSRNSWTLMTFILYGSIYFIGKHIGYAWKIFLGQPLPWDLCICIKSATLETEQNGQSLPRS